MSYDYTLDKQTKLQLEVLGEIADIFNTNGAHFWLRGGWAIDFMLGRITRIHEDLDLVAWVEHESKIKEALVSSGFTVVPTNERQTDYRKKGVDVQILYLTTATDGSIYPARIPEWIWRPDALMQQIFTLNGISARVMNPRQLLQEKDDYEQIGRIPRPKDLETRKLLQSILESGRF